MVSFHSFVANLLATVFMLMNLNAIMSVIFNVPAAVASTVRPSVSYHTHHTAHCLQIVACRAVRRLSKWSSAGPEV